MSLVQIKVIYDYYSSKRVTPFFIGEEELLEYDFQAFKERLVKEVPHLAKITSLSAAPLRITMNDEKNEVDLSPVYFTFQFKEMLSKAKNITLQAFTFESPSVQGVRTDRCEMKTNPPPNRPKHLTTLLEAPRAKRSLQLQGRSKGEGKNRARLTIKNSVKPLDCAHQQNLRTTPINKRHLSAFSQKQRSKLTKSKKLLSAFKTKKTKY